MSSWNDNGQAQFVSDPTAVYRSDFFPGLGWMLTRHTWLELRASWPAAFWDDWMRGAETRAGRQCVRPEVCRTYNFGKKGTSKGQFFSQYLAGVTLSTEWVAWTRQDLAFMGDADAYRRYFSAQVAAATPVESADAARATTGDVALPYDDRVAFSRHATALGIFKEWKDGVPRAAYEGVVTLRLNDGATRLFLVPSAFLGAARAQLIAQSRAERAWSGEDDEGASSDGAEEARERAKRADVEPLMSPDERRDDA